MKIALLLCFSIGCCLVANGFGAAVSTRAPASSNGKGTSRGSAPQRRPNPKHDHPHPQPHVQRNGNSTAVRRNTTPHHKPQNPKSQRKNARVVRRPNAKQRAVPNASKGGGIRPRQIPGIPAGPPDSDIDDKVVIEDPDSTGPTIIPVDPSPTAPQQNTDETEATEEPETTTEPEKTTIERQTTTTIAPQTTTTIAPQTTTTIGPQTTTTIAPQTTTTIAPQTTTTIKPQTPPPCIPVPPVKNTVVYVPQPVIRQGFFQQPPPLKKPPPVVVVNNEVSPGIPCPAPVAFGVQAARKTAETVTSYGKNMVVINNPKGAQQIPAMVYNNGRPPTFVKPSG